MGLITAALAGCVYKPVRLQTFMEENAQGAGTLYDKTPIWRSETAVVNGWTLMTVRKGEGVPARIYIEGDGRVYVSRNVPSGNPTPQKPVGLGLALRDGRPDVMYVGRPCQWVEMAQAKECKNRLLWVEERFTQPVVDRYVQLVAEQAQGQPVELVGFSGGAWIALQVAARLENVVRVVTVAGNLAPNWVNRQHKVMHMEVVPYPQGRLVDVPVVAYVGTKDTVVGVGVVDAYKAETGAHNVQVVPVEATHTEGWDGLRIN